MATCKLRAADVREAVSQMLDIVRFESPSQYVDQLEMLWLQADAAHRCGDEALTMNTKEFELIAGYMPGEPPAPSGSVSHQQSERRIGYQRHVKMSPDPDRQTRYEAGK